MACSTRRATLGAYTPAETTKTTTAATTTDALHDVHTATNHVLEGYRTLVQRAEPAIQAVIQRWCDMHQRHAPAACE